MESSFPVLQSKELHTMDGRRETGVSKKLRSIRLAVSRTTKDRGKMRWRPERRALAGGKVTLGEARL